MKKENGNGLQSERSAATEKKTATDRNEAKSHCTGEREKKGGRTSRGLLLKVSTTKAYQNARFRAVSVIAAAR